jgi:hypothetical protein
MTSLSAPDNKISGNVRSSDDDNRISTESLLDKPKFHLLIPAKKHSLDLCKVLLSAAVLNYPPPTLVGYGVPDEEEYQEAAAIEDTLLFLEGKEVRDGDLALIVNERTWFQLPAQLLIGRFNDIIYQANSQILAKYGPKKEERAGRTQGPFKEPLFKQKILFGAEKTCSEHSPEDVACTASPPSTLPEDIYGPNTDAQSNSTQIRPKYLYSGTMIGEVSSLRSLYQHAFDSLDSAPEGKGNQYIFSDIFGSQELSRSANLLSQQNALSRYLFGSPSTQSPLSGLSQTELITFYKSIPDFGITLDYSSSLFQILHRSLDDVHFVTSSHPTYINSPSKLASSSFRNAISLQLDLNRTTAPFKLHALPLQGGTADDPFLSLDRLPTGMAWTEVDLATNTVVPGAGVPAALAFPGTKTDNANGHRVSKTKKLMGSWWKRMWFQKYARALLRRYMRSPQGTIAAEAADEGGERLVDSLFPFSIFLFFYFSKKLVSYLPCCIARHDVA